jgi:uncharacterized cupredoxin-like copper-binding protein
MLLLAVALAVAATAAAHESKKAPATPAAISPDAHPWGRQGDPRKVTRTIEIDMADSMRFTPSEVRVKRGDTVRFVVRNTGATMHEMVLGTERALAEHAALMRKFPGMEHDEPYMAHVRPGRREEIVWTFDKPGTFHFGCLIPGHWEAGMKGAVIVAAR